MSLLQIAEPNTAAKPHEHKVAVGIDLGTTRSMVAVVRSGKAELIEATDQADTLLPSVVYYGSSLDSMPSDSVPANLLPLVGSQALAYFAKDPANTLISAKRFMGKAAADIKFSHPYHLIEHQSKSPQHAQDNGANVASMLSFATAQGDISPVQVAAQILRTLYERAASALPNSDIAGAVITVPAYFDDAQRQATKDAAQLAGITVLRLLNEPTAAAVAYGLDAQKTSSTKEGLNGSNNLDIVDTADTHVASPNHYLIYDLGGGTFDVSILAMSDGVLEVKATGGNSALGGDDIDRLIMGWMLKQLDIAPTDLTATQKTKLARLAEGYKQALSADPRDEHAVNISIDEAGLSWQGTLSNAELKRIAQPVVKRTLATCEQVLSDANLTANQLDAIVLVGGSTRMPVISQAVEAFFGQSPLCHINPDEVVALGAATVADQLVRTDKSDNLLLLDVTPLSLGLETMGGLVEVIIPRNTPIPISKKQTFTTYQDGQTGMVIHVVQGERDTVADCRSLGRFELFGIPPMKAGLARIEVTFALDADGQLDVSAMETSTGTKSDIRITPSYGLSDEQKEQLLKDGQQHAKQDMLARSLLEAKVEAEREVLALSSALTEFGGLLTADQLQVLNDAMAQVSDEVHSIDAIMQGTQTVYGQSAENQAQAQRDVNGLERHKAQLQAASDALKPHSDYFASLIMDSNVKEAMAGTKTDDWS